MKKIIQILFIAFVFSACNKQPHLLGEWSKEANTGLSETIIFKEDNTLISIKNGKVNELNLEGQSIKYQLDESHTPAWIDFVLFDEVNKEEIMRMKGIYEFLGDNTFRMYMDYDKNNLTKSLIRPTAFDKDKTKVYTRK